MTKPASELSPEELEKRRAYQREWYRKNRPPKEERAQQQPAAATTVLKIAPLRNGDDPGEALFYIADALQMMNTLLKRLATLEDKIQYLRNHILGPEHIEILEELVKAGGADDILAALHLIVFIYNVDANNE